MARNQLRPVLTMRPPTGTGTTHVTRMNRRDDPDRMVLHSCAPVVGCHVEFREER